MDSFEKDAFKAGFRMIAGIDEAGRGPLAGPVVASAVLFLEPPIDLPINDSKALTPKKREFLKEKIYERAFSIGIGVVWPDEIDSINILQASLKAMKEAVGNIISTDEDGLFSPDLLLIDGPYTIDSPIEQRAIIKGDSKSISIAAASIIAKTYRDALMCEWHERFPQYNFKKNKGYGTREHLMALKDHGPTDFHRKSFKYRLP